MQFDIDYCHHHITWMDKPHLTEAEVDAGLRAIGFDPAFLPKSLRLPLDQRPEPTEHLAPTTAETDLTDEEWEALARLIPVKYRKRPGADQRYRNLFDGLLWLSRRNAPATCLPPRYGTHQSIRKLRESMGIRGDMATIVAALPSLGLSKERTAALLGICKAAQTCGERIVAQRARAW
jgi:transposase